MGEITRGGAHNAGRYQESFEEHEFCWRSFVWLHNVFFDEAGFDFSILLWNKHDNNMRRFGKVVVVVRDGLMSGGGSGGRPHIQRK